MLVDELSEWMTIATRGIRVSMETGSHILSSQLAKLPSERGDVWKMANAHG